MSKGIRAAALTTFIAMSAQRIAGEFGETTNTLSIGNVKFRRAVCDKLVADFGITLPNAGSAYNSAFQHCKKHNPELVVNLGRAADKIGGRKRKNADPVAENAGNVSVVEETYTVLKQKDGSVFAEGLTLEAANDMIALHAKQRNKPNLVLQEAEVEATV